MAAKKIVHYQTDAKKASPELEKLKEAKLEADRKLSEERKLQVEAQRQRTEMENARRREELIERADAIKEGQDMCIIVRSRLLLLPDQLARKCFGKSQLEIKMIIDSGIREALTMLGDVTTYIGTGRHQRRAVAK